MLAAALAALSAPGAFALGSPTGAVVIGGLALSLAYGAYLASRSRPSPLPRALRWTLRIPRPFHTVPDLLGVLEPGPGHKVLEIGPGSGRHALAVARRIRPGGVLSVVDVAGEVLEELVGRAATEQLPNLRPMRSDARDLPYADHAFDRIYLLTVLGEVPEPLRALREIRRVLRPGGRLVVGEFFLDPDFVALGRLKKLATAAGLCFDRASGPRCAFLARFEAQ